MQEIWVQTLGWKGRTEALSESEDTVVHNLLDDAPWQYTLFFFFSTAFTLKNKLLEKTVLQAT